MKKVLVVLSLALSQVSFAAITGSTLESRHATIVEKAIVENCGYFRDLTELSSKKTLIHVDNGITDAKFTTVLTGLQRLDQNIFDKYTITVESEYADMYDHSAQDWGAFSVTSVNCSME